MNIVSHISSWILCEYVYRINFKKWNRRIRIGTVYSKCPIPVFCALYNGFSSFQLLPFTFCGIYFSFVIFLKTFLVVPFQQYLFSFFCFSQDFIYFMVVFCTLWLSWALIAYFSVVWLVHLYFLFFELLSKTLSTFTLFDSREKPLVVFCLGLVYSPRMEHKNKKALREKFIILT